MADVLDRRGQTAEAEAAALKGLELARRGRARLETACALLCLARIRFHAGNSGDARARLRAAREIIAACADPGVLTELGPGPNVRWPRGPGRPAPPLAGSPGR